MALTVNVERDGELLLVIASGEAQLADLQGFADLIATICRQEGRRRALVNLLEVRQTLAFTEHLQLGAHIGERLGFLDRMATVVPEPLRSGNSEKAAQKFGLHLRTFTDLAQARAWLAEPPEPARSPSIGH